MKELPDQEMIQREGPMQPGTRDSAWETGQLADLVGSGRDGERCGEGE